MIRILFFIFFCLPFWGLAQSSERIYLSGTGIDDAKPWSFYCTGGMQSGNWTTIPVPSCWELQGFGKYDYGYAKDTIRGKEQGLYKTSFNLPASAKGKSIELVFEGVMTDAEVRVNGKIVGPVHRGAFYAFSYDISSLVKNTGSNLLEVKVDKHSANNSVNAAERKGDYWIFGGIFRPVYVNVHPKEHIRSIRLDARADGTLIADAQIPANTSLTIELLDNQGVVIGTTREGKEISGLAELTHKFSKVKSWNPEEPYLYTARFVLWNDGKRMHTADRKIGFRTIEIRQRDGIYLNNTRVKLKGVNRHSFRPETGRATSKRISIEDVLLMKEMNMNAVRMSHYPPDDHFLDVCDSLGLLVLDELAGWHGQYDTVVGTKLVTEMIAHDAHHPSILMWVNGNEGGHNRALDPLFQQLDLQQRHVIHAWENFNGFDTQHYREFGYGVGNYDMGKEIVMPTEFLHGQFDGGHGAGIEDYWEYMWREPLHAGGFLWDFADQGVLRKDLHDSLDTDKHRAADGILGPHLEKEGSFFTIKQVWSPVFVERKEITPTFNGELQLENRYHFTNLNVCQFSWTLKHFDLQSQKELSGKVSAPDIAPGAKGSVNLLLPKEWNNYDVLYLTIYDRFKNELFTWSFPIAQPAKTTERMVSFTGNNKIHVEDSDTAWAINVADASFTISKSNGLIGAVYNANGGLPFSGGPVMQEVSQAFGKLNRTNNADGSVSFQSAFDTKSSPNTVLWTVYTSGWVKLEVSYFPSSYFTNVLGINFNLPEEQIKSVTYMGDGPYRVWKNRLKGNLFGVWTKEYNNSETGESPWRYPEFKGYHSNFYGGYFYTRENSFTVATSTENLFLRLYSPAWKTDAWHNYEPIFPSGDISFMNGISSIGSKTQRNETTGPMGSKHIFYDYEKDPARAIRMTIFFNFCKPNRP